MEDLKVKVNNETESKEAQELFFELGVSWFEGKYLNENIPCDRSIILHNFGSQLFWSHIYENKNFGDAKEITLPELRSMVFVDEPFFTPECTLNDQYAEIEQVRQNQKTTDAMREAEGILSGKKLKGMKYDNDKPRHSLLPKGTVNAVINVLEFGAKKYTVIDFYDRITIGKIIENRIWLSTPSVSSAGITKEFLPRVVVQNVIERSSIKYLHALAVKKKSLSQQKMGDVVLVTSLKELPNALWNLKLNKNISELTENHQILKKGSERESESDAVILNTEKSKVNAQDNETLHGTDSLCRNMSVFVSEDVQSAEVKNVHTLTTTIVQGNSETCFVVSAIKLSDCYKTLLILLEHYYGTSININEIGTVVQGANNWQKVDNAKERYYNAAMRHIDKWWNGEKCDPETNIHHLAHAATNLFFLMWFDENGV